MPVSLRKLAPLPRSFFSRDPREVARELLGKLLIRFDAASRTAGPHPKAGGPHPPYFGECGEDKRPDSALLLAGRIVEAEAYLGAVDPGAHSYRGQTPRNAVLFGPPGHAYIYFIYGNHYCTNVSCRAEGESGGVLLRALEPVAGIEQMAALRNITLPSTPRPSHLRLLTSGPGRLSQALAITRAEHNDVDLCSASSSLYIATDDTPLPPSLATPRINVTSAPLDLWRYIIPDNPFVSGPRSTNAPTI